MHARIARRLRVCPAGLGRPQRPAVLQLLLSPAPETTSGGCAEGLRLAARLLESDAFKDVADYRIHPANDILANDDALDLWIRQTVGTARHVSGTCKMGPDGDPMAVVDQYCRVKGIQGLWVADASVMPRIPTVGRRPCNGDHDRRTCRRLDSGRLAGFSTEFAS